MISVVVAFATPKKQVEISLQVEDDCTVSAAVQRSGILAQFPEIQLSTAVIGIYSKRVALEASLREGDRIEIYRPLKVDPKQARLLRAQRK